MIFWQKYSKYSRIEFVCFSFCVVVVSKLTRFFETRCIKLKRGRIISTVCDTTKYS